MHVCSISLHFNMGIKHHVDDVVWKTTRDLFVMNCNVNMIHQSEIPHIHSDEKPLWIITYKYINLKEDWKCHRKHTYKVNCILLSSSDHVGKGFLIQVAGFHTSVVSPEFIFFPQGETKQKNAIATCKENIMYGGIWNAHYMCRSMQQYVSVRSPPQVLASRLLYMNRKECQKIEKDNVSAERSQS